MLSIIKRRPILSFVLLSVLRGNAVDIPALAVPVLPPYRKLLRPLSFLPAFGAMIIARIELTKRAK